MTHHADHSLISVANFVELSMVVGSQQAFLDFGNGRHPAGLNLGDCFAYALARAHGEPLLFKGEDFRRTDIEAAE